MAQNGNYTDEKGNYHLMCACGHTVTGGVKEGMKVTLCPNCSFVARFRGVPIVLPELMEDRHIQEYSEDTD